MTGRRLFARGEPGNVGQVEAELVHAAGQMKSARLARRRLLAEPERAAWHRMIVEDCVACARARRRFARHLARGNGDGR